MDVKILVCYHTNSVLISNDVYVPIQVGKQNSKLLLPMIGDDLGDNISNLNGVFCELTGLYWGWKNIKADYIGLCHYRRIFAFNTFNDSFRSVINLARYFTSRFLYSIIRASANVMGYINIRVLNSEKDFVNSADNFANEIKSYLLKNPKIKAFALKPVRIGNLTNYYFFSMISGKKHVVSIKNIVKEYYPDIYPYVEKTLKSNKLYYANMVILKSEILDDYCTFIFDVLIKHYHWCLDEKIVSSKDDLAISRLMGYMAEFLTSSYISYLKASYGNNSVKLLTMVKYEQL